MDYMDILLAIVWGIAIYNVIKIVSTYLVGVIEFKDWRWLWNHDSP